MSATLFTALLALIVSASALELKTCDDLHEAFEMAKLGDVSVTIHPFADILCDNFTTFTLSEYDMDVSSSENLDNYHGKCNVLNVRFEVVNGAKLTWETHLEFEKDDTSGLPDLNGGGLYIGEGSTVRFLNDFEMTNIGVRSQTAEDSDFPDHQNDGGCVWNNGYFRVDGDAVMTNCENVGGGEGSPGRGGAIFNDAKGSVLFANGVEMSDISITDDEGNNGGAFYNLGKVNIRGDSEFFNVRAEEAGAIHNAEGAIFNFKNQASVIFYNCRATDGSAGAILNVGFFKFSGPAIFIEGSASFRGGQIYVGDGGVMELKKDSYFFKNGGGTVGEAVYVGTGGEFTYSESTTTFVDDKSDGDETGCASVYFEEGAVCMD